jgi:hypothetical protein
LKLDSCGLLLPEPVLALELVKAEGDVVAEDLEELPVELFVLVVEDGIAGAAVGVEEAGADAFDELVGEAGDGLEAVEDGLEFVWYFGVTGCSCGWRWRMD